MKTKLIILGSGSSVGVPRIDGYWGRCKKNEKNTRTRCSAIIIQGSNSVLIDASPDIKKQFLINKIKDVSSVLITHKHADQTLGLFELRPFFWKYKKTINIYSDPLTIKYLKKTQNYLFNKTGGYTPILKANHVKSSFSLGKSIDKINFKSISVKHGKIKSLGYIFNKTAYISDCKDLSLVNFKVLKNLNYLILDCLKFDEHPSHFNLEEVLYINYMLKPKKTILTNLHYDLDYDFLVNKLPKNVLPGHDGLHLNL
jgi:phosphoribosyl 1,2-cyclic phosphate phosphodiesterase